MPNWQFLMLLGFLMIHLYWTSPEKPLPALVLSGIFVMASPFTFAAQQANEDKEKK